ncbi:MAG: bifunctional [glutamate--ammonia ligase]-adenylyl-L-tyrosine phosphorylase/[glutamate--ammonia-ligase] adenylyltransferase, partial [Candidatus Dadabacteria bacterium]|nr:bifunctional [glutamate--ammonia ligase]-adenylyl-L-tyrosine phosphorylase/[glutamate--ammonia-ligase] adenylyltransferase [Candidatus Dadabacteria bacterium]NIQ13141.1 bifunctional [glutamate--ammonia ligase]-adenylyl-L-tyrosine phosphorylase/[glutamate--ammonia-ligase] adenylyltransferase [Candidatus Dadabacteria bacterium]
SKEHERILSIMSSHSRFLGDSIISNPGILKSLSNNKSLGRKKTYSNYLKSVLTIVNNTDEVDEFAKKLRKLKYKELSRIIYREINELSDFRHTMEEISDLASAFVNGVLEFHRGRMEDIEELEFVILGMGKLGGRLLNLSSDIDLIYLFNNEDESGSVFKLAEQITKTISSITEDRFLYRVDLGLRPGGNKSTIAVHVEGAIEHYYYWGETWERAVFIKARPIAGDIALGDYFLNEINSFVYKKSLDYTSIEDLKDMKIKINRLQKKRDVKLGSGGIRELEFFVQALQLVNAGELRELQGLNTLDALNMMTKLKLIDSQVRDELSECYMFLRKVEHSIQLFEEQQTHKIPSDELSLARLSKRLGFRTIEKFENEYQKISKVVSKNYGNLFYDSTKIVEEKSREFWELADFLTSGDIGEEETIKSLGNLGFKSPDRAIDIMSSLLDPKRGGLTEKGRIIRRKVIPAFLSEIIKSHNPDEALVNLERFVSDIGLRSSIYSVLSENPEIIKLLSKLFSRSGMLSSFLIKYPEYLDAIILKDVTSEYETLEEMIEVLNESVRIEKDFEDKLNALRRFRHVESLKLCFRDLNEEVDPVYVGKYLSRVAKAVMEVGLAMAKKSMKLNKKEKAVIDNIVIIGLGKLGGGEMSYNSDLDIIFIYEGNNHELFSKLGQRFISNLSVPTGDGYCYKIDLDLRPSGNAGALVTSFSSFRDYHKSSAQLWERQSLIRAVVAAGNKELGSKVLKVIDKFVYDRDLEQDFHKEIFNIRSRIENELAKENKKKVNLKTGKGGLIDIEFLVQMLQLKFGSKHKELRVRNTIESLYLLKELNLISKIDFNTLHDGYMFLKKLENLLRLLHDRSINDIKEDDFDKLAVEYGFEDDVNLLRSRYEKITDGIRKTYNKYFLNEN